MSNNFFEELYNNRILPKYGNIRDKNLDEALFNSIVIPNKYDKAITRKSLHHLKIISIDPNGCTDADDAFSIYEENDKLFLAIHIADPTYYLSVNSELWNDILNRTITHYPSNREPIHMMPDEIINRASLMTDNVEEIKKAISVIFEINKNTLLPTNNVSLEFSEIKVKNTGKLTYQQAGHLLDSNDILKLGSRISINIKKERSKKTIGTRLSEVDIMIPHFNNGNIEIPNSNQNEKLMKEMIGEFAILTNSFIGEYIKKNMNGLGIFRTCQATFSTDIHQNISGEEILTKIIEEGVKAEYLSKDSSHDLVGMPIYCHFTSPMRRVSDCICHFLIKAYVSKLGYQWNTEELKNISSKCYHVTKKEKAIQYDDQKFRVIQLLYYLVQTNIIQIRFKITGYSGLFLNCNINRIIINQQPHKVHISYSLRRRNLNYQIDDSNHIINISQVNPFEEFDEGKLVELDYYLDHLFI